MGNDNYWKRSCGVYIGQESIANPPQIHAQHYSLTKFKQCLQCVHFHSEYESYRCKHEQGRECLLQIGFINHFERRKA